MEKLSNAFVPNFLLGVAGGIQYLKLKSASKNPRKTSEQTLRGILTYAKDTVASCVVTGNINGTILNWLWRYY